MQFRRACPQIACGGKELEQVISADVVFAQEFVMVKLTQLGEQDEADGKRGKPAVCAGSQSSAAACKSRKVMAMFL